MVRISIYGAYFTLSGFWSVCILVRCIPFTLHGWFCSDSELGVLKTRETNKFFWQADRWFIYALTENLTAQNCAVLICTSGSSPWPGGMFTPRKKRYLYIKYPFLEIWIYFASLLKSFINIQYITPPTIYATTSHLSDTVLCLYNGVIYSQKIPHPNNSNSIFHNFVIGLRYSSNIILQYAINVMPPIVSLK